MIRRLWLACGVLLLAAGLTLPSGAQAPVPTLVPPTPIPTPDTGVQDALVSESALARIQADGLLRVGILYNEVPFGLLNIRGDVAGFDADLARSMATAWGVDIQFVQVTRQTAVDMLLTGQVDMLAAAIVHHRSLDTQVEFSHTYYRGSQAMMVRNDDGAASLNDMAGRNIGYVIGTASEEAIQYWQQQSGISANSRSYLTLDQGLVALVNGEIDGLVSKRFRLGRIVQPGVVRILDDVVMPEPYAIALRRQDVNLRNLVNRTLQYLAQNGRMNEIYNANFPGTNYPEGLIPLWENLGEDAPQPGQYEVGIPYPAQYVVPRLLAGDTLRVAGLVDVPDDAPESERRLEAYNRAVIEALAARWGVTVAYLPDSGENALDLVAAGQADIALGVYPDWNRASTVDFSSLYLLHGDRLMVPTNQNIESFNDLRGGKWVGIFASEPGSADQVNALAQSISTAVNIYTMIREQDVPIYLLEDNNADVAFGDSLKLIPHVQALPDALRLAIRCTGCDPWYTRRTMVFGLPRNDIDFRLLVEYTLQEMAKDGTITPLLQPVMLPEDVPAFDVWPGPPSYLGFSLAGG